MIPQTILDCLEDEDLMNASLRDTVIVMDALNKTWATIPDRCNAIMSYDVEDRAFELLVDNYDTADRIEVSISPDHGEWKVTRVSEMFLDKSGWISFPLDLKEDMDWLKEHE